MSHLKLADIEFCDRLPLSSATLAIAGGINSGYSSNFVGNRQYGYTTGYYIDRVSSTLGYFYGYDLAGAVAGAVAGFGGNGSASSGAWATSGIF